MIQNVQIVHAILYALKMSMETMEFAQHVQPDRLGHLAISLHVQIVYAHALQITLEMEMDVQRVLVTQQQDLLVIYRHVQHVNVSV